MITAMSRSRAMRTAWSISFHLSGTYESGSAVSNLGFVVERVSGASWLQLAVTRMARTPERSRSSTARSAFSGPANSSSASSCTTIAGAPAGPATLRGARSPSSAAGGQGERERQRR